ncbi:MAG: ACT domain-containing protein [Dehalococcoidia bacterium]|nr:ACT domain-containing protein [Dehalococcoidia bacterium]MDW8119214.1 malic enzyme-like NAD(P)-binding protein [Chloroflexota bacterium]
MPAKEPEVTYSVTVRAEYPNRPGMLGRITTAIGEVGGDIGAVDLIHSSRSVMVRDFTVNARDTAHAQQIVKAIRRVPGVKVIHASDRVFLTHLGGKIGVYSKVPLKTRTDLSLAYTPGVGRVSMAIHDDPQSVWTLTSKANTVAVVTDGTAVLGLGDVGPAAALPVMEGKALLFKELGGVDAWPLCLATKDVDEIVRTVKIVATGFGGINLEDIAAPRCFEIEERLVKELDIPVMHDDQHATAVAVLAGLTNACKLLKRTLQDQRTVILGAGASAIATAWLLLKAGMKDITLCDRQGILYAGRREHMNPYKEAIARQTNPRGLKGDLMTAVEGADVFIGLSGPGLLTPEHLKRMNPKPIVFAMANPVPEIFPEEAAPYAAIIGTGRSDYPNQINNALVFPGMFRGVLDVRARQITDEMKLAAAEAIASVIPPRELNEEYIVPSVFDRRVVPAIAKAVAQAAYKSGVAQRSRRRLHMTRV